MERELGQEYENPIQREAFLKDNCDACENKGHMKPYTPFDFELDELETVDVSERIINYDEARKRLNFKDVKASDITQLINEINPRHIKALIALNRLFTIAEAWNKEDGFVPDFGNNNQIKHYPYFGYELGAERLEFIGSAEEVTTIKANIGSLLCFQTSKRARKFGEMFWELYNEVFLMD